MNKAILMGRLTRDPETRNTNGLAITRYTLAVDRRYKDENGETGADFLNIVAFGKAAEFAEKYFHKGTKVLVTGRIQTGSFTNKDGIKVYTTDIVAEDQEFAESKRDDKPQPVTNEDGFMNIPEEEELPFAQPPEPKGKKKK